MRAYPGMSVAELAPSPAECTTCRDWFADTDPDDPPGTPYIPPPLSARCDACKLAAMQRSASLRPAHW